MQFPVGEEAIFKILMVFLIVLRFLRLQIPSEARLRNRQQRWRVFPNHNRSKLNQRRVNGLVTCCLLTTLVLAGGIDGEFDPKLGGKLNRNRSHTQLIVKTDFFWGGG